MELEVSVYRENTLCSDVPTVLYAVAYILIKDLVKEECRKSLAGLPREGLNGYSEKSVMPLTQ